ncbi:MAG: FAD-dependent oxidoreductase [Desulfobacterales bacterium]|nr:FAD-dependent oxidoreductase [Desulfobacterales bacterium]
MPAIRRGCRCARRWPGSTRSNAEHGSLIRGALARLRARGRADAGRAADLVSRRHADPGARAGRPARRCRAVRAPRSTRDRAARRGPGRVRTTHGRASRRAAGAERAGVPARPTLLEPLDAALAAELAAIRYRGGGVGGARVRRATQVGRPLDGFGMLIPSRERAPTLGALFSSTLFPGRAPDGRVLLTAFIGGARNATDDRRARRGAIVQQVLCRPRLRCSASRARRWFRRVQRWPRAIPQYELGHLERLARIDARLRAVARACSCAPTGATGISVADCVAHAAQLLAGRL